MSPSAIQSPVGRLGRLTLVLGALLLSDSGHAAAGFGFISTESPSRDQVIDPQPDGSVRVAWIVKSDGRNRVLVSDFRFGKEAGPVTELFSTSRTIWGLKLETSTDGSPILAVIDGPSGAYRARILKFDPEFVLQAQTTWASKVNVLQKGRMLSESGKLHLAQCLNDANGRFFDIEPLSGKPWYTIQYQRTNDWHWESYPGNYYNYKNYTKLPPRAVSGIDSAMTSDGKVTALYDFGGIRMRCFSSDGTVLKSMKIDGRPYSGFQKLAKTSVDVLDEGSALLAGEWHDYVFNGLTLVMKSSENYYRGLRADGTATPSIRLNPQSTKPDIQDTPTVALSTTGGGAVAWAVRGSRESSVWLQRLDHNLEAFEPPRLVDGRPGFMTDKPFPRTDPRGRIILSWRCTSTTEMPSEVGILDLSVLERGPAGPRLRRMESGFELTWDSPPACEVTLWHSRTLDSGHAVPLCTEMSACGVRTMEHEPDGRAGFYWLTSK